MGSTEPCTTPLSAEVSNMAAKEPRVSGKQMEQWSRCVMHKYDHLFYSKPNLCYSHVVLGVRLCMKGSLQGEVRLAMILPDLNFLVSFHLLFIRSI